MSSILISELYPWTAKYTPNAGSKVHAEGQTYDANAPRPKLFEPLTIRGVTFKNRVVVSPMCTYSAGTDGTATDWHFAHLAKFALGGAALAFTEVAAVSQDGRISPYDLSLHDEAQVAPLKRIADFYHANGAAFGMQIGHAGRKGSTPPPFSGRMATLTGVPEAWQPIAPSPIPYAEGWAIPVEMSKERIVQLVADHVKTVQLADQAGVDVIELHAAHGYLFNQFLSPLSNHRTDEYGGSFENRIRALLEVVKAVRQVWTKPLFLRLSAVEHVEGGWDMNDTNALAKILVTEGVDVLDVSTGGNAFHAKYHPLGLYQVAYAEEARRVTGIKTMAVGKITTAQEAEEVLTKEHADFVAIGRQHLRDPNFTIHAAEQLHYHANHIPQYAWAIGSRGFNV